MAAFFSKTCRKCSLTLIFMLLLQWSQAQADFSRLQAILKKNEKSFGKEYILVVHKEGKNIFLKEGEDLKLKTPVPLASASAWFTAALVIMLADEGKISLDDPIAKYIPVFEKYMKGYITIRNCLNHTTGLDTDAGGILKLTQKNKFESLEEEVKYFAINKLIVDNPGQAFAYSGVGLRIAGRVLEVVTKKTFDRLITEKLFRPMGMRTATFYNESGGAIDPATGASCSAFDYTNFMQMIMNKGVYMGKRILSENAIATLLQVQATDTKKRYVPDMFNNMPFTLGCWVQEEDETGKPVVFSLPNMMGAWPWFDTKAKYAAVLLPLQPLSTVPKKEIYLQIKQAIDESIN